MTPDEIQAIVYTNIMAPLLNLMDEQGNNIQHHEFDEWSSRTLTMGYQQRPGVFRHNYQRNKFLRDRDRYIVGVLRGENIHILTEHNKRHIVIYEASLRAFFGRDSDKVLKTMTKMLGNVYDTVKLEHSSPITTYDVEERSRDGYTARFNAVR